MKHCKSLNIDTKFVTLWLHSNIPFHYFNAYLVNKILQPSNPEIPSPEFVVLSVFEFTVFSLSLSKHCTVLYSVLLLITLISLITLYTNIWWVGPLVPTSSQMVLHSWDVELSYLIFLLSNCWHTVRKKYLFSSFCQQCTFQACILSVPSYALWPSYAPDGSALTWQAISWCSWNCRASLQHWWAGFGFELPLMFTA